jgi:hypothetical protein
MNEQDVPSPIDLCDPRDAPEWERTAQGGRAVRRFSERSSLYDRPEQRDALLNAGFSEVRKVAAAGTLVMHRAS